MDYWTKLYGRTETGANNLDEILTDLMSIIFTDDEEDKKPKKKTKNKNVTVLKDIRPTEGITYNKKDEKNFKPLYIPKLKRVQFSPPATIAWFVDGSKSVAVAGHGDEYDKETGLAICMLKRVLGNKEYRRIMDKYCYVDKEKLS